MSALSGAAEVFNGCGRGGRGAGALARSRLAPGLSFDRAFNGELGLLNRRN
jgi:hypothetical protein